MLNHLGPHPALVSSVGSPSCIEDDVGSADQTATCAPELRSRIFGDTAGGAIQWLQKVLELGHWVWPELFAVHGNFQPRNCNTISWKPLLCSQLLLMQRSELMYHLSFSKAWYFLRQTFWHPVHCCCFDPYFNNINPSPTNSDPTRKLKLDSLHGWWFTMESLGFRRCVFWDYPKQRQADQPHMLGPPEEWPSARKAASSHLCFSAENLRFGTEWPSSWMRFEATPDMDEVMLLRRRY